MYHSTISIGANHDCDVVVDQPTVSSLHCRITWTAGHAVIVDAGSRNGTFVNGVRVHKKELVSGDIVTLGKYCCLDWARTRRVEAPRKKLAFAMPGVFLAMVISAAALVFRTEKDQGINSGITPDVSDKKIWSMATPEKNDCVQRLVNRAVRILAVSDGSQSLVGYGWLTSSGNVITSASIAQAIHDSAAAFDLIRIESGDQSLQRIERIEINETYMCLREQEQEKLQLIQDARTDYDQLQAAISEPQTSESFPDKSDVELCIARLCNGGGELLSIQSELLNHETGVLHLQNEHTAATPGDTISHLEGLHVTIPGASYHVRHELNDLTRRGVSRLTFIESPEAPEVLDGAPILNADNQHVGLIIRSGNTRTDDQSSLIGLFFSLPPDQPL